MNLFLNPPLTSRSRLTILLLTESNNGLFCLQLSLKSAAVCMLCVNFGTRMAKILLRFSRLYMNFVKRLLLLAPLLAPLLCFYALQQPMSESLKRKAAKASSEAKAKRLCDEVLPVSIGTYQYWGVLLLHSLYVYAIYPGYHSQYQSFHCGVHHISSSHFHIKSCCNFFLQSTCLNV